MSDTTNTTTYTIDYSTSDEGTVVASTGERYDLYGETYFSHSESLTDREPEEGDEYLSFWECPATDADGNVFHVTWMFEEIKGEEYEEADRYPWDDCVWSVDPR